MLKLLNSTKTYCKGTITLHDATTIMQDTYLPFTHVNGVVNFDQYDSDYDITGFVRNSKLHVKGTGSNSNIDLTASSNNFAINDCSDLLYPKMDMPYQKKSEIFTHLLQVVTKGLRMQEILIITRL